ncbi:hypothetical protein [Segetibacter koreensis]|uniref:hypothetical protein n=1 Tax=Segetibacter koreensis TaxID=398037 RepID=UPI00036476E4|nr:hypothetical protein [Segetibacter koreensis]
MLFALVFTTFHFVALAAPAIHVWETQQLTFKAANSYKNPFTDVTVCVDLSGPGYDDDNERPIGPTARFKDYVRYRNGQGYNWVNVIAAFPIGRPMIVRPYGVA